MFIRCKSCHGSVWVESSPSGSGPVAAACPKCKQHYEVEGVSGRAGRDLAAAARQLASEQQIDLPGAYSVLLKIVDLESLREVSRSAPPEGTVKSGDRDQRVRFDPAFQEAVQAGLLSARQAAERGGREAYATSVAKRHGVSLDIAYAVTDNRLSLLDALRARKLPEDRPLRVSVEPQRRTGARWLAAAVLVVTALAVVLVGTSNRNVPSEVVSRQIGDALVRVDSRGRVVEVRGPDPRSVLRTFCVAGERPFHALEAVPSSLHGFHARIGLLRDPAQPSKLLAITIEEDRASKGWVAGDGKRPLVAAPAPPGVVEANVNRESDTRETPAGQAAPGPDRTKRN